MRFGRAHLARSSMRCTEELWDPRDSRAKRDQRPEPRRSTGDRTNGQEDDINPRKDLRAVAALFAAHAVLNRIHVVAAAIAFDVHSSYFAGSCSVLCRALAPVLSARPRAAETPFAGLDRMYRPHRYLGIAALLSFNAHYATVPGGANAGRRAPRRV